MDTIINFIKERVMNVDFHHLMPFLLFSDKGDGPKLNTGRVIEALIISGVTAIISSYVAIYISNDRLTYKIEFLTHQVEKVSATVDRIRDDFYKPIIPSDTTKRR